jgi:hypothetical protein
MRRSTAFNRLPRQRKYPRAKDEGLEAQGRHEADPREEITVVKRFASPEKEAWLPVGEKGIESYLHKSPNGYWFDLHLKRFG